MTKTFKACDSPQGRVSLGSGDFNEIIASRGEICEIKMSSNRFIYRISWMESSVEGGVRCDVQCWFKQNDQKIIFRSRSWDFYFYLRLTCSRFLFFALEEDTIRATKEIAKTDRRQHFLNAPSSILCFVLSGISSLINLKHDWHLSQEKSFHQPEIGN
jgi:hypothetical protein